MESPQKEEQGKSTSNDALALLVLQQIEQVRHEINDRLDELRKDFLAAVPHGDIEGHRRYHELLIKQGERREKLRDAIIEKTITGLAGAALFFVLRAIWMAIRNNWKG